MSQEYLSQSVEETAQIAARFASARMKGGVVGLIGELGSGKTAFVQAVAGAFGVIEPVQSPTFVLLNAYPITHIFFKALVHIDCYRLDSPQQLVDIGYHDFVNDAHALILIEWADKIPNLIPPGSTMITLYTQGENRRRIVITS